jgi:hypothetical protein
MLLGLTVLESRQRLELAGTDDDLVEDRRAPGRNSFCDDRR